MPTGRTYQEHTTKMWDLLSRASKDVVKKARKEAEKWTGTTENPE